MATYVNREFWTEFIRMYKSFPAIWDPQHENYTNRKVKNKHYEKLLQKLHTIEPKATKVTLTKRIMNLRSSYRRELVKVQKSQRSGRRNVHKPYLWYFDELSFVKYRGIQNDGETLIDVDPENNCNSGTDESSQDIKPSLSQLKGHEIGQVMLSSPQSKSPRTAQLVPNYYSDSDEDIKPNLPQLKEHEVGQVILSSPQPKRPRTAQLIPNYYSDTDESSQDIKPDPSQLKEHLLEQMILSTSHPKSPRTAQHIPNISVPKDPNTDLTRTEHLVNDCSVSRPNQKDEADIFAAGWATLFRKLSPDQQLYANKIIGEVLYQGALGNLTEYS